MKIQRVLSKRAVGRVKWMSLTALGTLCLSFISSQFAANVQAEEAEVFSGPFYYEGNSYSLYERREGSGGYIEEYSTKSTMCMPDLPIVVPGTSLMNDVFMGIVYVLVLFWFFLGIAIVADIFMEAIEVITSKTDLVTIPDADGHYIQVEKMFWNPTIANLTLMALGSSAPEIILATAGVALDFEGVPSDLGPMSIVGSAAFNLLVISCVSILAVGPKEVKPILDVGVFFVTAIFSVAAYVWFYLVLVVISPNRIELWEALVTFGAMIVLVGLAYGADRCRARNVDKDEQRIKDRKAAAKAALRILKDKWGTRKMIQAAQGEQPEKMSKDECDVVRKRYKEYLDPEPLEGATIDELIDMLNPDNPVERIAYRKKATVSNKHEFVRVGKNTKGQFSEEKEDGHEDNKIIGFKHLRYSVPESNEFVTVTIEKKIGEDVSFWVRTVDDTAKAPGDYEAKNELITMKAHEKERNIQVIIVDDD